ncbi:MAG: ParB N-terminal domain-containing protein [Lachnospiraceae bacterium]|nr:ParB N-terminal domain-containing protein [Lachnospiraceae bacterium]
MGKKLNLPEINAILEEPNRDILTDIMSRPDAMAAAGGGPADFDPSFDLSLLTPYPDHKFQIWTGERFKGMVESIKEWGIHHPLIAWDKGGGSYIILSGHNRQLASLEAGKAKGPVIFKRGLTEEEADIIVTETNLLQRSFADLRHSERAYCLKQHYEAMKRQGKRTDLINEINVLFTGANPHEISDEETSDRICQKLENRDRLALEFGLSKTNIAMYIRIAELNKFLLGLLDDGALPFTSAYNLAFIGKAKQNEISEMLRLNPGYKVRIEMSSKLRSEYESGRLSSQKITDILDGKKKSARAKPVNGIRLKPVIINKWFTKGESYKEIESVIEKALEKYFEAGGGTL